MKDGEIPAFPNSVMFTTSAGTRAVVRVPGMTLRDWFAGQAIVGCVRDTGEKWTRADIAMYAYVLADEMLKERAKHE